MTCDPSKGAPHTVDKWFDYACFTQPTSQFAPGASPAFMGNVRTPGARDLDISVYKNFTLGKERNLRFEVSSYNVTNTVQFGYPSVFWNQSAAEDPTLMTGFGEITYSVNTPRQFQFATRFTF